MAEISQTALQTETKSELALLMIGVGSLPRLAQVLQETEAEMEKGGGQEP